MRIISQNKDLSIDFNHTPICVSYNHVCAIMDGQQKVIGKYETDERAKEVFKEIHIAYSGTNILLQNMDMDDRLKKACLMRVTILVWHITKTLEKLNSSTMAFTECRRSK